MVIVLLAQAAVTPAGKPVDEPIPVATVVEWVIAVNAVLIHKVGDEDAAPTVLLGCNYNSSCGIHSSTSSC